MYLNKDDPSVSSQCQSENVLENASMHRMMNHALHTSDPINLKVNILRTKKATFDKLMTRFD